MNRRYRRYRHALHLLPPDHRRLYRSGVGSLHAAPTCAIAPDDAGLLIDMGSAAGIFESGPGAATTGGTP